MSVGSASHAGALGTCWTRNTNPVGTQISSMRFMRSVQPLGTRSVSNIVRPTVYCAPSGGHRDVEYSAGCHAPGSEWQIATAIFCSRRRQWKSRGSTQCCIRAHRVVSAAAASLPSTGAPPARSHTREIQRSESRGGSSSTSSSSVRMSDGRSLMNAALNESPCCVTKSENGAVIIVASSASDSAAELLSRCAAASAVT